MIIHNISYTTHHFRLGVCSMKTFLFYMHYIRHKTFFLLRFFLFRDCCFSQSLKWTRDPFYVCVQKAKVSTSDTTKATEKKKTSNGDKTYYTEHRQLSFSRALTSKEKVFFLETTYKRDQQLVIII